ncbi:IS66 family insertion sequence element accessory protein TnpB [Vibrio hyugaensis]|uniref:IS66 family insertion sequence element accessory protein TnpB n=1 Tax=Vibrio hyugaensis TaxID=1534743 RepID=UPI0005F0A198|nr:IS66 family insertion sequence element accessory protein TnpB [Vibrio hyugaensis]
MKPISEFGQLYLYPAPVDFRKSIDGLSYLVEQSMKLDPFEPALFLFCNRAKDKVKAIYWDRTGFALWYKRLDRERFRWPSKGSSTQILESHELEALLAGFALAGHRTINAKSLIE